MNSHLDRFRRDGFERGQNGNFNFEPRNFFRRDGRKPRIMQRRVDGCRGNDVEKRIRLPHMPDAAAQPAFPVKCDECASGRRQGQGLG